MQPEDLITWSPEFVLRLEHYKGMPDDQKPHHANTRVNITYVFRHEEKKTVSRHKITIKEIMTSSFIDLSKSWIKHEIKSHPNLHFLLKHEQGHFDLAEECARAIGIKMNSKFKGKSFSCNSSTTEGCIEEINKILGKEFRNLSNDLRKSDKKYDEETNYGRTLTAQEKYNIRFSKLRIN